MVAAKFSDIVRSFCEKKGFNKEQSANFELFVTEVFQAIKGLMETKEYDFIAVKKLGTFFLKVWTVHSRMKELEKRLVGYMGPRMSTNHYRDEKRKYDELCKIYERMTTDFFDRKLYFAERKQERKEQGEERRLNQQYMADIAMEDIENEQPEEQIDIEQDETDRDTETGLGEQG